MAGVQASGRAAGLPAIRLIECGTDPNRRGQPHPITIHPDWTVSTPHDLHAERVGRALGGYLSCLDVVDVLMPLVRGLWEHRFRLTPPSLVPLRGGWDWAVGKDPRWHVPGESACGGCGGRPSLLETAPKVATHLRGVGHWRLLADLTGAQTRLLAQIVPGEPAPPRRWPASSAVRLAEEWGWLWEAGVHPAEVTRIHTALGLRGPMAPSAYLHVLTESIDLDWLRQFVTTGAAEVAWAACTYTRRDQEDRSARERWRASGLPIRVIPRLMDSPYSLADVDRVARELDIRPEWAARLLGRWASLSGNPRVDEIVRVWKTIPFAKVPMETDVQNMTLEARIAGTPLAFDQAALILTVAGDQKTARRWVDNGARTFGDLLRMQRSRTGHSARRSVGDDAERVLGRVREGE